MEIKTYVHKGSSVKAIEYMGFNWEDFIYFSKVVDWSISDKLSLRLKDGNTIKLRLCDWLVFYQDGTCEVLSSQDFYNEYECI